MTVANRFIFSNVLRLNYIETKNKISLRCQVVDVSGIGDWELINQSCHRLATDATVHFVFGRKSRR